MGLERLRADLDARLKAAVEIEASTPLFRGNLGGLEVFYALRESLGEPVKDRRIAVQTIRHRLSRLKDFTDVAWRDGIDLVRALAQLDNVGSYRIPSPRTDNLVQAASRMLERGYAWRPVMGGVSFAPGELERATFDLQLLLDQLGQPVLPARLLAEVKSTEWHQDGMHVVRRTPGHTKTFPNIPVGFLMQLAVRTPLNDRFEQPASEQIWEVALSLAADIACCIDVEPYNPFQSLVFDSQALVASIRELAMFDHIFCLRQWPVEMVRPFLKAFLDFQSTDCFESQVGWWPEDLIALATSPACAAVEPSLFSRADVLASGVRPAAVDPLLRDFAQPDVNREYRSPINAKNASWMLRPLIAFEDRDLFTAISGPIAAPAFFTAATDALRERVDNASHVFGIQFEKAISRIFQEHGIHPTVLSKKYKLGKKTYECDLVVENEHRILLIETKLKGVQRSTMGGDDAGAVLDLLEGSVFALTQALRHERLLRTQGKITFKDRSVLEARGREIHRIAVLPIDHGGTLDRLVLKFLMDRLLTLSFHFADPMLAERQRKAQKVLDDYRSEWKALTDADLVPSNQPILSLHAGQLWALLARFPDLEQFTQAAFRPLSYGSLNILANVEYYQATLGSQ